MSTYIMLGTLTDEGRKTLKDRPDQIAAFKEDLEAMGARVTGEYAVLGSYDFVHVVEAPSNEVMARISVELGSQGSIKMTTVPAIPVADFVSMLKG